MREAREETVVWRYFNRDVVPFSVILVVECITVGSNTLFKAATLRGLSFYVYIFYSYVVATIVLLPLSLIFGRYLIFSINLALYIYYFQQYDLHIYIYVQVKKTTFSQISCLRQDFLSCDSRVTIYNSRFMACMSISDFF